MEEKKKPIVFCQESESQKNEEEVLTKRIASAEPAQKRTGIEEPIYEDAGKVVGAALTRRRSKFTPVSPKKKKVSSSKRKDTRQKSVM